MNESRGGAVRRGRVLLLVVASALALGVAELLARAVERPPWWEAALEEQREVQGFDYRLNSLRLRDREYGTPRPPEAHRTLVLGDSFTFGLGVEDPDELFCERLEQRFNESPPDSRFLRYDVLNAGIPWSLTGQWREAMRRVQPVFQPQVVLAVFFLRDGTTLGFREDFFDPMRERMVEWRENSLLARWSALWRLLRGRAMARSSSAAYVQAFHDAYFGDAESTAEWRVAQDNLRALRDECRERGQVFHLIVFPLLHNLDAEYPLADVCAEIEAFGAGEGIPTFSLLPAFRGHDASTLWVSPHDQHPNAEGHRIAADALEAYLRPLLAGN